MSGDGDRSRIGSSKGKWLLIVLVVIGLVAAVAFVVPALLLPPVSDEPTVAPVAPDFERQVRVERGRLVLPPVAGGPATIHFDVTNLGERNAVYLREVAIEHGESTDFVDTVGPDMRQLANVAIDAGKTVSFGSQERQVVLARYDSNVVPGADLVMRLTFSDGATVSVPLTVESSVGRGGTVKPQSATGSVVERPD